MSTASTSVRYTYIVEHLDPEIGPWSTLEYAAIAAECSQSNARFCLSSVPKTLELPPQLRNLPDTSVENRSVEEVYQEDKQRVCLLDPAAEQELSPSDAESFHVFLFGGILGDDPPRDRTAELRKKGYSRRRLGPRQMTTDTAVRVTRLIIQGGVRLDDIKYIDHPELKINEHESTEMPFRYIEGQDGKPIMPKGMIELIIKDSDKAFDDLV